MINNVAGFMIKQLISKFPDLVDLGNITSSQLFGTTRFEADFGSMSSVHSLERSGDVIVEASEHEVTVTLKVTFTRLEIVFEEYNLFALGISTAGRLETKAVDNEFRVVGSITDSSECFVTLKRFDVLDLGNYTVNMIQKSGKKWVQSLGSSTVTSAVNFFEEKIRSTVEAKVRDLLSAKIAPSKFVCQLNCGGIKSLVYLS